MTRVLHLLRSEPDEIAVMLITALADGKDAATVACLYPDTVSGTPVDWNRILEDIFAHDKVICWW